MLVEAVEAKAEQTIATTTQVEGMQGNAAAGAAKQEETAAIPIPNETTDAKNRDDQTPAEKCNADDGGQVVSSRSSAQEKKNVDADKSGEATPSYSGDENGEFPEESGLKGYEMKALTEFKSRLEEAILTRSLFEKKKEPEADHEKEKGKSNEQESVKKDESNEQETSKDTSEGNKDTGEKQSPEDERSCGSLDKGKEKMGEESNQMEIDENGKLWGVPLLPSRGDAATDTILMKFLRAREFKVNDALEMLRNTLKWRIQNKIDSILEEDLGSEYDDMAYMSGVDREGHPICFNLYGAFADDEFYNRTFATAESVEKFLRWRVRLMEKEIQNLDFKPGGISSLLQINDLKDTPGPARKDIRLATKNAVSLLENNYPEFVTRNVFINAPFWYYAFKAILSPFSQRSKSKLDFARPSRVTETLLKYIAAEHIPIKYGGLKREKDPDFSTKDEVSEVSLKAGGTETIEIQAPEVGSTLVWDLTVTGWEVNYKEEFVPTDESSYALIVKRQKWIGWQEESARNTFKNKEPGKIVITVENGIFKKKRILYRFKIRESSSSNF